MALALCAAAACGGPGRGPGNASDQDSGKKPSASASPTESTPTSDSTAVPTGDVTVDTDFAAGGNPDGWGVGPLGPGTRTEVAGGAYRVTLAPGMLVGVHPRLVSSITSRSVGVRIQPRGFRGAALDYGISCMRQVAPSGDLGDAYLLLVSSDGLASISEYRSRRNRPFSPPQRVPGWNAKRPPALLFSCDSDGRQVRLSIGTAEGQPILQTPSGKKPLTNGVVRLQLIGAAPSSGVDFAAIRLVLAKTAPVG